MKIKNACRLTLLTERAIRLYIENGLLTPAQRNGMLDFSDGDLRRLRDIGVLRRYDFSIEQIRRMLDTPDEIPGTIRQRMETAQTRLVLEQETVKSLDAALVSSPVSVRALVESLSRQDLPPCMPDFSHIDALDPAERLRQTEFARQDLVRLERRKTRKRRFLALVAVLVVLCVGTAFWGSRVRMEGQIPLPNALLSEIGSDGCFTFLLSPENEAQLETASLRAPAGIGPGPQAGSLDEGQTFPYAALELRLTNWDLLQLGRNPFYSPASAKDNLYFQKENRWRESVVRQLLQEESLYARSVRLWTVPPYAPSFFFKEDPVSSMSSEKS